MTDDIMNLILVTLNLLMSKISFEKSSVRSLVKVENWTYA